MQEKILEVAKRRAIIYPSFEVYGGLSGFFDYGPVGCRIKKNFEKLLRDTYVLGQACMEVECPTLSPEDVWVASGHVDSFTDVIAECGKCGEPYRADHVLEGAGVKADGLPAAEIMEKINSTKTACPKCGGTLTNPYEYNLMFQTFVGPGKYKTAAFLRPETAQTTYLAFRRLWEAARKRLPFGVLQVGRSFRNEISPRQGMVRLREFNQAEIQFFVDEKDKSHPGFAGVADVKARMETGDGKEKQMTYGQALKKKHIKSEFVAYQLATAFKLFTDAGIDEKKLKLRQHAPTELAFYSADTWDVEFASDGYGRIELVGIADRTDYDLTQHAKLSGKDFGVSLEDGRKFTPNVIEVAYGIDRPIYCILESCFKEEKDWNAFTFPKKIAPYLACVYPLQRKDGLPEKAKEVHASLVDAGLYVLYDQSGSIGKRYARADEVGVPYCITVDYDSLKDDTVTLRDRDSRKQERVPVSELRKLLVAD